jgi:hypothetical protein
MLTQCRFALRKSPVTGGQHEKGKINKQEYKKKTMFVQYVKTHNEEESHRGHDHEEES